MPAIKPKKGQCFDCEDGPDKYLTAGRCDFHYWKHRKAVNDADRAVKGLNIDKQAKKKALDLWYHDQIAQMPGRCENCGEALVRFAPWAARAYVAHIVAKRNIESVMVHPFNRVYLCIQCHANYDNWPEAKVKEMPVLSICLERFSLFADAIADKERRYLPAYFSELV